MRILIIVPRWFIGDIANYRYMFPLGLAYISSTLKRAGHAVNCLNLNHFSGPIKNIISEYLAKSNRYDFICTGGIVTFYNQIKEVIDAVHTAKSGARLIVGGGIISSEPELMFDSFKPDYIVTGEGEEAICELIKCCAEKGEIGRVAGIGYKGTSGMLVINQPRAPIMDLDSLPYPDFEGFEFKKYLDHMHPSDQFSYDIFDYPRVYPIVCSRSCPFLCTFCFHPLGNRYRQRSVDSVIQELEENVRKYRINIIAIYDELFSNNREWLAEFCRRVKRLIDQLPWECKWGCQMRVDKVDDEMLREMKGAGCYIVSYGLESYSPAVLKSMKKHIAPEQIDRAIRLTLGNGISIQGNFLFGDTAETLQTARDTLDYWKKQKEAGIILTFINPYPGTQLYNCCLKRGIIKDKMDFIQNHIFDVYNMSDTLTEKEFGRLWFEILMARIKYRNYAKEWSAKTVEDGTVEIVVKCPHCGEKIEYKNYLVLSKALFFMMMYCRACRRRYYIGSNLYQFASRSMLFIAGLMPNYAYHVYKKVWGFLKQHDFRYKKNRLGGLVGRLSDDE